VDELVVVVEPDPLRGRDAGEELLVGEALVDSPAERLDGEQRDDGERR